eukprot:PhF_6_TR42639/c1_g1_i1/m.64137
MGNQHPIPGKYIQAHWVPDELRPNCFRCGSLFSWWLRQHHCRCCGDIFCRWCWGTNVTLPKEYGHTSSVPVCRTCESLLQGKLNALLVLRRVTVQRKVKIHPPSSSGETDAVGSSSLYKMVASHRGTSDSPVGSLRGSRTLGGGDGIGGGGGGGGTSSMEGGSSVGGGGGD